jgi:hypothetical protein
MSKLLHKLNRGKNRPKMWATSPIHIKNDQSKQSPKVAQSGHPDPCTYSSTEEKNSARYLSVDDTDFDGICFMHPFIQELPSSHFARVFLEKL